MSESHETKSPPAEVIRDGNIKANIWRNKTREGEAYYSTTFARGYRDDSGEFRETHSFGGTDLLKLSELSRRAYERSNELRKERSAEYGKTAGGEEQDKTIKQGTRETLARSAARGDDFGI